MTTRKRDSVIIKFDFCNFYFFVINQKFVHLYVKKIVYTYI